MKTILFISFILISFVAKAQLFVTIDPAFFKTGILYNQKVNDVVGCYARAQYGRINLDDFYTDNIKVGSGISLSMGNGGTFYVGTNYNHFFNTKNDNPKIDIDRVSILSFDIGMSLTTGRFTMLLMTDPINWESIVCFSYKLKKDDYN
jgi:hypothetical protein